VARSLIARLARMVFHNKGAKLIALVLAAVTWYAIRSAISFEMTVTDIPLTIQVDDGWAILDRSAKAVEVMFRGSREDMRYLNRDQIKVVLDLRGQPMKGSVTAPLHLQNINAPGAARPVFIQPAEVTLRLDQEDEKQVPVKADFLGSLPEGYELEKVACTPASVLVRGPRQRLREVQALRTAPIDLEGRIRSFRKPRLTLLQPSEIWTVRLEPSEVAVEVAIVERSSSSEVADVPVKAVVKPGARPKLSLWPTKVTVSVKGRAELVKAVGPDEICAFVDCSELDKAAKYDLPVKVTLPAGVTLAGVEPATIDVNLSN